jgi:heme/copper-type cytochrome/quinol oxidase subunit 4
MKMKHALASGFGLAIIFASLAFIVLYAPIVPIGATPVLILTAGGVIFLLSLLIFFKY